MTAPSAARMLLVPVQVAVCLAALVSVGPSSLKKALVAGLIRIPPLALTAAGPDIVPPVSVNGPLTVMAPEPF